MAKVVFNLVSLIFQGVKCLVFNFPPASTSFNEFFNIQTNLPTKVGSFPKPRIAVAEATIPSTSNERTCHPTSGRVGHARLTCEVR